MTTVPDIRHTLSGGLPAKHTAGRALSEHEPAGREKLSRRLMVLLRGRWPWVIAVAVLFGAALGFGGWQVGSKVYVSHGQIHVAPYLDDYGLSTGSDRASQNYEAFIETQMELLKSDRVVEKAMESEAWRALGRPASQHEAKDFADNLQLLRKGELIFVDVSDPEPAAAAAGTRSVIKAYDQLCAEEDAQRGKGKLDFFQSELAKSINRISQLESSIKARFRDEKGYENFSVEDLPPLFAAKLSASTAVAARLEEVKRELGLRNNATNGSSTTKSTQEPSAAVGPVRAEQVDLSPPPVPATLPAARVASGGERPAATELPTPEEIAVDNIYMAQLIAQRRELQNQHRRLLMKYGGAYTGIQGAEADLDSINDAIQDFTKQYIATRARHQEGWVGMIESGHLRDLAASLAQSAEEAKSAVDAVTQLKRDVQTFQEQVNAERKNRDDIQKRIETQDRLLRIPGRIQVVESGTTPNVAYSDSRPRLAALGGALGLALGVASIALLALFDGRVRGLEDARSVGLGWSPVLGLLAEVPHDLKDVDQAMRAAHGVHQIRTMLQLWYGSMAKPVFAVTGPESGTGKTTLTMALGLSFATARTRTLLIDLDFVGGGLTRRSQAIQRPKLGSVLRESGVLEDVQLQNGLREASASQTLLGQALLKLGYVGAADVDAALAAQERTALGILDAIDGKPLSECIFHTEYPDLSILPAGRAQASDATTVSPVHLQRLLDSSREDYDVVLIDTGPLPGSLEASAVVAAADGVILTVSRGDQRVALRECVNYLESAGARLAGVVFNRATARDFAAARDSRVSTKAEAALSI